MADQGPEIGKSVLAGQSVAQDAKRPRSWSTTSAIAAVGAPSPCLGRRHRGIQRPARLTHLGPIPLI
jgi:hypothetical protein